MNWYLYCCPQCKKLITRYKEPLIMKDGRPKKWIRSWCEEKGIDARIQLVEGKIMEWQPIETAPKDGTEIILWNKSWQSPHSGYYGWRGWEQAYECGPWKNQPTHWMPLPEPPKRRRRRYD